MPRYKQMPMPPDQIMLFGTSVEEALPIENDVRAFRDVMDCLDFSLITAKCASTGAPPYPPDVMVKILGYAYSKGMRSSRKIEDALYVDVRFIWLAGGLKPDHNTLSRFRRDNEEELSLLFRDSVRVCCEAGLVFLNALSVDGTKILSGASKNQVYSQSRLDREMGQVKSILREAEEVDIAEESDENSSVPEHLRDAKDRKAKLDEISKRLRESERTTVVLSEPDSRVMLTGNGKLPAYNMQAAVDGANQIIVAMKLTNAENDHGQLPGMVEESESNTGLSPDTSIADTGYSDESTLKWIEDTGHDTLMPSQEHSQESTRTDRFASRFFEHNAERDVMICPEGKELSFKGESRSGSGTYRRYEANGCQQCAYYRECVRRGSSSRRINVSIVEPTRRQMRQKLRTPEGRRLYNMRQQIIEPVFGRIKANLGFDRFLLKGLKGAKAEAALICMAHNLLKCINNAKARAYFAFIKAFTNTFINAYQLWLIINGRLWQTQCQAILQKRQSWTEF